MLKQRLAVGVPLSFLLLLAFLLPGRVGAGLFLLLALGFISLAVREFFTLSQSMGLPGFRSLTTGFACLLVVSSAVSSRIAAGLPAQTFAETAVVLSFIIVAVLVTLRRFDGPPAVSRLLVTAAGFTTIVWTLNFVTKLYFADGPAGGGRMLALFMIMVTKLTDVGAYAAGSLTARRPGGNHKLAPRLSPKKSWEGLAGGMAAGLVAAAVFAGLYSRCMSVGGARVLGVGSACCRGLLFAVLGLVGDLAESVLKRAAGAKDSGRVPGLGGALDMADSLIFVSPAFYLYVVAVAGG